MKTLLDWKGNLGKSGCLVGGIVQKLQMKMPWPSESLWEKGEQVCRPWLVRPPEQVSNFLPKLVKLKTNGALDSSQGPALVWSQASGTSPNGQCLDSVDCLCFSKIQWICERSL